MSNSLQRNNYNNPQGNGFSNNSYNNNQHNNNNNAYQTPDQQQRKAAHRRTIDHGTEMGKYILNRNIYSNYEQPLGLIRPDASFTIDLLSPQLYKNQPIVNEHTKFVHLSANKAKHQIHAMKWTPFGRRLLVASHSGEFTLWNGSTFNFESIMQLHDSLIYALQYSHNGDWLISGDQDGTIKYWQPNFNNVNILNQVHTGCITDLCFAPNDSKFVSSSDDHQLKIWNFNNGKQELTLAGHHWDVKSCDWHPSLGLIVSGSKDNMMNLWDPRVSTNGGGKPITTIRGFKHTVQKTKFQPIGTQRLLAATAKDKSLRIFDIRQMKDILILRNQQCDFATLTWHPTNSQTLTISDFNGKIEHFIMDKMLPDEGELPYTNFKIPYAHEKAINQIEYNRLGNILCTASSDKSIRFWSRSRPADPTLFKEATYTNDKNGAWYYNASANNETGAPMMDGMSLGLDKPMLMPPPPPPPVESSMMLPGFDSTNGNQIRNNISLPGF